jgi:hypothetical protein
MDINQLPEGARWSFLLNASLTDLLNICEVNQQYQQICSNNYFWKLRTEKDFGVIDNPNGLEWVQIYKDSFQQQHLQKLTQLLQSQYLPMNENTNCIVGSINRHVLNVRRQRKYFFVKVDNPTRTLILTGAINWVAKNYPNREGYERFVYWPTYRMAGTINDIVKFFRQNGVNEVYDINGNLVPLSEEVIARSSFDPLNPVHAQYLANLSREGQHIFF